MSEITQTPRKPKRLLLLSLVVLVILVVGYIVRVNVHRPNTTDAYVYAETVRVIPEVKGTIVSLPIIDNQRVRANDTLFVVDPTPYQLELTRAQGALVALDQEIILGQRAIDAQQFGADAAKQGVTRAKAAAKQSEDTYRRMQPMLSKGYVSAEALDLARTAMVSAQAQVVAAQFEAQRAQTAVTGVDALVAKRKIVEADIALAQFNLDHTIIRAPFDGIISGLKVQKGQVVGTLLPTMTLINTSKWYVVANFRETELAHIQPGAPARLYLLGNKSKAYQGRVESIGFGVMADPGGDLLPTLPYVAKTINWVRVEQRFPVRIEVENPDPNQFRVGASATATIHP